MARILARERTHTHGTHTRHTHGATHPNAHTLNPGLTALGWHGGPTQTHALLDGSLAIDAGDDALAAAYALAYDQRGYGFGRIADSDGDTFAHVDIGAFELAADEYFGSL